MVPKVLAEMSKVHAPALESIAPQARPRRIVTRCGKRSANWLPPKQRHQLLGLGAPDEPQWCQACWP